jgi:hypothetical protein
MLLTQRTTQQEKKGNITPAQKAKIAAKADRKLVKRE